MTQHPAVTILEALNKCLALGFALRESCQLTDRALGLKAGTAKLVLKGGAL